MICPRCKSDMIVVEHNKIELDYCTNCEGVWFDSRELDLLLESMSLESPNLFFNNILNSSETRTSEKRLKCPLCKQKMKKTTIGQPDRIIVDVCWQGDGLWFDGGELTQLIRQLVKKPLGKQSSEQQVINFLGEVFKV